MAKFLDLTGQRFGKLTVIKLSNEIQSGNRKRKYWLCKCDCGNLKEVRTDGLTRGTTKSCGCLKVENSYKNLTDKYRFKPKYKIRNKRLYSIWHGIFLRCNNINNKNYGAKGITICNEWLDFDIFASWALENGYKEDLTIDRIDNDKGYSPSNCRWVDRKVQNRNRTNNIFIKYKDKNITLVELSEITNIPYMTLRDRYYRGDRGNRLIRPVRKIK